MAWPVLGYDQTIKDLARDRCTTTSAAGTPRQHDAHRGRQRGRAKVIEAAAGSRPSGSRPGRAVRRAPPARVQPARSTRQFDRFKQQIVLIAHEAAPAVDAQDEEAEAVASILGGENSRFYWNIVQTGSLRGPA